MSDINLIGLTSSWAVPGVYIQVDPGAGQSSAGEGTLSALILGNKLSTGSATADTVLYGPDTSVAVSSESDVIAQFGSGSEIHRSWLKFTAVNQSTPVYMVAVSEGGSAQAASLIMTIAGTATSAGAIRIHVGGESVDVGFAPGDGYDAITDTAVALVNAQTRWAVVASDDSHGALTLTAKQKGTRGNLLRAWAQVIPSANTGVTVSTGAPTLFSGGSVSDNNSTALATVEGRRFYYIVSAANDATNLSRVSEQVDDQALPLNGIRQRFFSGSSDTLANTITLATGVNDPRGEIVWQQDSDWTPSEVASLAAAVYSLEESGTVPVLNLNSFGNTTGTVALWSLKAPEKGTAPTPVQLNSALQNGITPIAVSRQGSYLVKRITSHSLTGSTQDFRIRDAGKLTVCDFFGDQAGALLSEATAGKLIGDDPIGNEPAPPANVFTPRQAKGIVAGLLNQFASQGLVQDVGTIIATMQVQRNSQDRSRLDIYVPLFTADSLDKVALLVSQVG